MGTSCSDRGGRAGLIDIPPAAASLPACLASSLPSPIAPNCPGPGQLPSLIASPPQSRVSGRFGAIAMACHSPAGSGPGHGHGQHVDGHGLDGAAASSRAPQAAAAARSRYASRAACFHSRGCAQEEAHGRRRTSLHQRGAAAPPSRPPSEASPRPFVRHTSHSHTLVLVPLSSSADSPYLLPRSLCSPPFLAVPAFLPPLPHLRHAGRSATWWCKAQCSAPPRRAPAAEAARATTRCAVCAGASRIRVPYPRPVYRIAVSPQHRIPEGPATRSAARSGPWRHRDRGLCRAGALRGRLYSAYVRMRRTRRPAPPGVPWLTRPGAHDTTGRTARLQPDGPARCALAVSPTPRSQAERPPARIPQ